MTTDELRVDASVFFGKNRGSARKVTISAWGFSLHPKLGIVSYKMSISGQMESGDFQSVDMFSVFRDFMAEVREVIRHEMAKEEGVNLYFEQEGKLVKVDDLAQIYLFAVPW